MNEIMQRIEKGIQYRDMRMSVADVPDRMIVRGYATTFNEPYVLWEDEEMRILEQVDSRAFEKTDMTDVIMQYDHRGRVFARTRNNTLEVTTDDEGLFIEANLGGTEIGRELYEEIRGGYTDRMSFGFTVTGESEEREKDENGIVKFTRRITQVGKLYDVSAVSIPANDGTSIGADAVSRSLADARDGVIERMKAERLEEEKRERNRRRVEVRAKALSIGGEKND
jgi:HK97 family phage prohead protease